MRVLATILLIVDNNQRFIYSNTTDGQIEGDIDVKNRDNHCQKNRESERL